MRRLGSLVLLVHVGLLAWLAYVSAPVTDEPGQLAAGLSNWRHGTFVMYRVTGPLVRLVGALPVLCVEHNEDWHRLSDGRGQRPEYPVGLDFCSANGERIFWLMTLARWACLPFTVLGALVCRRWATDLAGPLAGFVALTLWCFCPNVLGHGHLVMTDVAGTALFIASAYVFWRWLQQPDWANALLVGIVTGLLQLTKSSYLLTFPLWTLLWLVHRVGASDRWAWRWWIREGGQLAAIHVVTLYVLNAGYGFEGSFTRLGDYQFVSQSLTGSEDDGHYNRFQSTWLGRIPVPLPRHYVLGTDLQRDYFERTLPSYLHGEWKSGGWWYYYLYGFLIKVPIGTLALLSLAVIARVVYWRELKTAWRDEWPLLIPAAVLFAFISSQTGFSKNFRYAIGVFPFLYVWIGYVVAKLALRNRLAGSVTSSTDEPPRSASEWQPVAGPRSRIGLVSGARFGLACSVFLLASVAESLSVYPHSLSFFNRFVGGPRFGHEHLIHTNIDFGQDLLFLKDWLDQHQNGRPLGLAYYGTVDPRLTGIEYALPPMGKTQRAASFDRDRRRTPPTGGPVPGLQAVSVNLMRGHSFLVPDGSGAAIHSQREDFTYFLEFTPVAMAGYSIYIFDVSEEEANRVRRKLGWPPLNESFNPSPIGAGVKRFLTTDVVVGAHAVGGAVKPRDRSSP